MEGNPAKLIEIKTFDIILCSDIWKASAALAKIAAEQNCTAKLDFYGITLTADPFRTEQENVRQCLELYNRRKQKPENREWWTILFSPDDNPIKLQGPIRFETKEKAEQWANQYYRFNQYEVVQVREVLK